MTTNSFAGSLPWSFGTKVDTLKTSSEVLTEAGLTWGIDKQPLTAHLTLPDASHLDMPVRGKYTIRRDDNNCVIGVVGKNYRGVPNSEAAALLDSFCEEREAKFKYAGCIGEGEKVFFNVSLPKEIRIKDNPDEVVSFNLLLTNAFNGTKSLEMHFVPVLDKQAIVLNPDAYFPSSMSIRHTNMYDTRIKEVRRVFKLADGYFDNLGEMFNNLADISISKDKFQDVLNTIMPIPIADPATGEEPNTKRVETARELINQLVDEQNLINKFPNTGWSIFVAIANYSDHERSFKSRKGEAESKEQLRFISILEGTSQALKNNALEILLKEK